MEKLKVAQAIVVEGKYDKIKLSAVVDGVIICTNGFGIYKDKTTAELIRFYARTSGIIILTDSDSAGFQIRNHLKGLIQGGKVTNLYIPEIFGKEKRKSLPSKEGKLGVEGIDADI
ncbi:MAG: toprim domain-containing protein, partial [Ruminococcus sp.]|nr:toprim domain-containing protein [Ruminococcus sp.]